MFIVFSSATDRTPYECHVTVVTTNLDFSFVTIQPGTNFFLRHIALLRSATINNTVFYKHRTPPEWRFLKLL
jgi:hypothetical protein